MTRSLARNDPHAPPELFRSSESLLIQFKLGQDASNSLYA